MPDMVVRDGNREERIPINYPSNSHADRNKKKAEGERPRPKPVVTGTVTERPRGIFSQVIRDFVQADSRSLAEYVILEVMLPSAKNLVLDMLNKGGERMLYGISRPASRTGRPTGFYNYGGVPQASRQADPRPTLSQQARTRHRYDEVVIPTRGEADDVLNGLKELVDLYGSASVSDLYDLLGYTGDFPDTKWGWEDLRRASVRTVRGGYILDLPETVALA
jgi:hypothetical protein